jgi:CheY-like chemotaxis protein
MILNNILNNENKMMWLMLLVCISVAGICYLVYKLRLRKMYNVQKTVESKLVELQVMLNYAKECEKTAKEETVATKEFYKKMFMVLNHEIRNPLNGVSGMTELLLQTSLSKEQAEYVHSIHKGHHAFTVALDHVYETAGISVTQQKVKTEDAETISLSGLKLSAEFSQQYPLNILVAEDDPINQELAIKVLQRLGYDPQLAKTGKEVLELAGAMNFDLIFMDIQMPEMDGLEATKMLRLCLSMQPVIIAMTANVMEEDKEACLEAGMDDYISKPVNLEVLIGKLQRIATVRTLVNVK